MEEVLSMTQDEYSYWLAYFKVKADKERLQSGYKPPSGKTRRSR